MPSDRQYEFVYVLAPTVANAEVETLQRDLEDQIGKLGGAVENTDLWGRRKLAYPIGNFTEGIYVVQLIRGPGTMVTELERRMRVHDDVLRYLTVRVDDDLRKARRAADKRKADAERRRAARGAAAPASPPAAAPAGESKASDESPAAGEPKASGESPAAGEPQASDESPAAGEPKASGESPSGEPQASSEPEALGQSPAAEAAPVEEAAPASQAAAEPPAAAEPEKPAGA